MKIFNHIYFKNLSIVLVLFLFFLIPTIASADTICLPLDITCYFINFAIYLINALAISLLSVGTMLLSVVIAPDSWFSLWGYTTTNPIIGVGWPILRNLANAALIIGLIIIAINIILGNNEEKAKKSLIDFIIIALLINFTPAICAFLIDSANILMNSFLTGGINNTFTQQISASFAEIKNLDQWSQLLNSIFLLVFSLIAFAIYCLYAILFVARHVVLWILVIVSPVAFATKVFPQSKYINSFFPSIMHWDDWLSQFIQWCVIGIPAGLFIYLSNKVITSMPAIDPNSDILIILIANIVPIIFLVVGFFITISSGEAALNKLSPQLTSMGQKALGKASSFGMGMAGGVAGASAGGIGGYLSKQEARADGTFIPKREQIINRMQQGWTGGKETATKEGIVGGTMLAAGHVIGGAAGATEGGGKWAIRRAAGMGGEGLKNSVIGGGQKGWTDGAIKTASRLTGEAGGALYGELEYDPDFKYDAKGNIVSQNPTTRMEHVAQRAAEGGTKGESTLGKAGAMARDAAKGGAKNLFGEMTKNVVKNKEQPGKKELIKDARDKLNKAKSQSEVRDIYNGLTPEQRDLQEIKDHKDKKLGETPA
ncbi:MAG: hypothetical protein PHD31_01610 [Candidatus Pacebacteria bacterium]|nr:hypothetical protein [Candidatus Paceibacterota bacterium]